MAGHFWGVLLAVPGIVFLLIFVARPELFIVDISNSAGGTRLTNPGPLFRPLGLFSGFLIYTIALVAVSWHPPSEKRPWQANQIALVQVGLLTFSSYKMALALQLALAGIGGEILAFTVLELAITIIFSVGTLLAAIAVLWRLPQHLAQHFRPLLFAALAIPMVVGAMEFILADLGLVVIQTIGIWRIMMVAFFAYAVLEYHLFGLEWSAIRPATAIMYGVMAVISVSTLWSLQAIQDHPWLGTVASVGLLGVLVPAAAVGSRTGTEPLPLHRRQAIYRAVLEETERGRHTATGQNWLGRVRSTLGITPEEHITLLALVQSEASPPLEPGTRIGRFQVKTPFASGGHAQIFLAEDLSHRGIEVVIKEIRPELIAYPAARRAVEREVEALRRLSHPHVVGIIDVIHSVNRPAVVALEYLGGGSLAARMERGLDTHQALVIIEDTLAGLTALHHAGIAHNDVKPDNIFLSLDGRAKVGDLGLAGTIAGDPMHSANPAGVDSVYYPPAYHWIRMLGAAASDVFAVGVVLYQIVMGAPPPIAGTSPDKLYENVIDSPALARTSPGARRAIADLLTKALGLRKPEAYLTAEAMAADVKCLRQIIGSHALPARPDAPSRTPRENWPFS